MYWQRVDGISVRWPLLSLRLSAENVEGGVGEGGVLRRVEKV